MIGTKHELWKTEYRKDAYVDQMGIKREAQVVTHKVIVEIVEVRDVKGDWGGTLVPGGGWRGLGDDGQQYYNNWNSFDDASMSPRSTWLGPHTHFITASKYTWGGVPYMNLDGTRAFPRKLSQAPTPLDYQI